MDNQTRSRPGRTVGTKVLLVDDDEKLVSLLERGMAYEGFDVVTAGDGEAALQLVAAADPHVVLLDIGLVGIDGFETCRRLRLRHDLPIIMLTGLDATADIVRAFELGADDYLTKPFALEVLVVRIRAVLRRAGASATRFEYADLIVDLEGYDASRRGRRLGLTRREFEILGLLARHPRQVLTRQQIIDQVWGVDGPGQGNAVEAHMARLRRKMEAGGEPRLIETIRGIGYALRGQEPEPAS